MKWLSCGLHGHYRDCQVELQIMPKLYLGPGLSQRVHQALSRRLEQFMAANVAASATPAAPAAPSTEGVEFPVSENPALPAQTGVTETDSEKEKDQDRMERIRKIRKKEMLEEMMTDRDLRG